MKIKNITWQSANTRLAFAILLLSIGVNGQPVFDATSSAALGSGSSITVSHTTGSSSNMIMLVAVSTEDVAVSSVKYGTDDLIPLNSTAGPRAIISLYYLLDPSPGTDNVVATLSGNEDKGIVIGVNTFSNVDSNNPLNTYFFNTGNGENASLTGIPTATNERIFSAFATRDSRTVSVFGTGQTARWNLITGTVNQNDRIASAGSTKLGDGTTSSFSYTVPSGREWVTVAISIRPTLIADLQIAKSVDNGAPYAGETVIFTLTATNNSTSANAPNVVVNDVLPTGYIYSSSSTVNGTYDAGSGEWAIGTLNNGASATLTIQATVLASGNYQNTATISSDANDPNAGNNSASVGITICQAGGNAPLFNNN